MARRAVALLCTALVAAPASLLANPTGGQVVGGGATIDGQGTANVTIQQTRQNVAIRWENFDIEAGERTHFEQPRGGFALNRITNDLNGSRIAGTLTATGKIALINPAGFLFEPGSVINTQGLIAATQFDARDVEALIPGVDLSEFGAESLPGAAIRNRGSLIATDSIALIAEEIESTGSIRTEGGQVLLAAGGTAKLTDALGISIVYTNESGVEEDLGDLVRRGGAGGLRAALLRAGRPEASGAVEIDGRIVLRGGDVALGDASGALAGRVLAADAPQPAEGQDPGIDADLQVAGTGSLTLHSGSSLRTQSGDLAVDAGGDVLFRADETLVGAPDTVIETETGDVTVVAGGAVDLAPVRLDAQGEPDGEYAGDAAIRSRGRRVVEREGDDDDGRLFLRNEGGGNILVWARGGDIDAGRGNRWLELGPGISADDAGLRELVSFFGIDALPADWDAAVVHRDGILGIGSEAGSDVTLVAAGDVTTRNPGASRSGGTASGFEGERNGAHVGVFGAEHEIFDSSAASFVLDGAEELHLLPTGEPDARLRVVAGGSITGDVMMSDGTATVMAGYALTDDGQALLASGDLNPGDSLSSHLRGSERSDLEPFDRGSAGTLPNPLTLDLVRGSVDILGRNGVYLRTIENPTLVYAPPGHRHSTYGPRDHAWIEAERGPVTLLGVEDEIPYSGLPLVSNPLVRLLPPQLYVRTHRALRGGRELAGDLIHLNDFLIAPSTEGKIRLQVAGEMRAAETVRSGTARLQLSGTMPPPDQRVTLGRGTRLVVLDPEPGEEGLEFELIGEAIFNVPGDPQPAQGAVVFHLDPKAVAREGGVTVPAGTQVVARDGRVYTTVVDRTYTAAEARSEGSVTLSLRDPADSITVRQLDLTTGALELELPGRAPVRFFLEDSEGVRYNIAGNQASAEVQLIVSGRRNLTWDVRAATPGSDALPRDIRMVLVSGETLPGVEITNPGAVRRTHAITVDARYSEVGNAGDVDRIGLIDRLVRPLEGVRSVSNPGTFRGVPPATIVEAQSPSGPPEALAQIPGLVGDLAPGTRLSPLGRPEIVFTVAGVTGLEPTASIFKELQVERDANGAFVRTVVDPDPSWVEPLAQAPAAEELYVRSWQGDPLGLGFGPAGAVLRQSDAQRELDLRGQNFNAFEYYATCRRGVLDCGAVDRLTLNRPADDPVLDGTLPPNRTEGTPARIVAEGGIRRMALELPQPATVYSGGDIVDLRLVTQHTQPDDVTQVIAPYGDLRLGEQIGLAGIQAAGPGQLRVLVGVVPHTTPLGGFGEGEDEIRPEGFGPASPTGAGIAREDFAGPAEAFDRLDDLNGPDLPPDGDGRLFESEARYLPTGRGGRVLLDDRFGGGDSLGLQTVGSLRDLGRLASGGSGADLLVVAGGDIALGSYGQIGTLDGGEVGLFSLTGGLSGGQPGADYRGARGVFTARAYQTPSGAWDVQDTGAETIWISTDGDINAGGLGIASLSQGDLFIQSRGGSVTFGEGENFAEPGVQFDLARRQLAITYAGTGVASVPEPGGTIVVKAREDINLGAGALGGTIRLDAVGDVNQGTGSVQAQNIAVSGRSISGSFSASGSITATGNVGTSTSLSAGGFVAGGGSASTNASRVNADTVVSSRESGENPVGALAGGAGTGSQQTRQRTILIDVTSRPCSEGECD